jgi:Raf kinase inhibitor-like YbhB/YbcL family protein
VRRFVIAGLLLAILAACGGEDREPPEADVAAPAFPLTSEDVAEGEPIDPRYTCDGDDVSPTLAWENVPEEAEELVLIVEDPDAPGGTFTHWLAYGIDPAETTLGQGTDGVGFRQGENDMGEVGYGGPCPPGGETHDYVFRLLAVDAETGLEEGARRDDVLEAVEGHVVGEARLTATYARPSR